MNEQTKKSKARIENASQEKLVGSAKKWEQRIALTTKRFTVVRIENELHLKLVNYAEKKGMKLTKVVEFAILDYLTKAIKT